MILLRNRNPSSSLANGDTSRAEPIVHTGMTAGNHLNVTVLTLGSGTTYRKMVVREDWSS